MGLYAYVGGRAVSSVDPWGLMLGRIWPMLCGMLAHNEIVQHVRKANKGDSVVEGNLEIQTIINKMMDRKIAQVRLRPDLVIWKKKRGCSTSAWRPCAFFYEIKTERAAYPSVYRQIKRYLSAFRAAGASIQRGRGQHKGVRSGTSRGIPQCGVLTWTYGPERGVIRYNWKGGLKKPRQTPVIQEPTPVPVPRVDVPEQDFTVPRWMDNPFFDHPVEDDLKWDIGLGVGITATVLGGYVFLPALAGGGGAAAGTGVATTGGTVGLASSALSTAQAAVNPVGALAAGIGAWVCGGGE